MENPSAPENNPYAPPLSAVVVSTVAEEKIRRPASTKWALGLFVVGLVAFLLINRDVFEEASMTELLHAPLFVLSFITRLFGVAALVAGNRKPWGYYGGSAALAYFWFDGAGSLYRNVMLERSEGHEYIGTSIAGLLIMYFFSHLCWRLIFSGPSREYYRVARQPELSPDR